MAVKKITQKNNLLWCKLTDERIQYFKISGIYLLRYGDAVTAKIPLFTNVKISDEERFFLLPVDGFLGQQPQPLMVEINGFGVWDHNSEDRNLTAESRGGNAE